jgi:Skp family chaperone for outer membrane proteins
MSYRLIAWGIAVTGVSFCCDSISAQAPRTATRSNVTPQHTNRAAVPADPSTTRTAAMATRGSKIAVIDISEVFKNHTRFKQAMEEMRKDVEGFEGVLKQHGAELQKKREQLQEVRPGSPDYDRIEREIASFQAQVQADTQLKRKEFLQKEALIYYNVYAEVVREVEYFAQRQGIDLVVRFNSGQIDPQDRKSVLEGVNRAVVFQRQLNITSHILARLNGPAAGTARQPGPTSQR